MQALTILAGVIGPWVPPGGGPAVLGSLQGPAVLASLMGNEVLALLAIVTGGLLLGRVRVAGLSLGTSGVIFTALALGYLGFRVPAEIGRLGLIVFTYCVGLTAGPRFFRMFGRRGNSLALVAITLVGIGALTALGVGWLWDIPADLSAGIFAGALTSTPGLAAAMEALPPGSQVAVGYGIAYPFGVVAVVLFVQLLPRLLRVDLTQAGKTLEQAQRGAEDRRIVRALVEVCNPAVFGKTLSALRIIEQSNCQVSRILEGARLVPVPKDLVLAEGQRLLLVARAFRLPPLIDLLGKRDKRAGLFLDVESQSLQIVISSPAILGKTLVELNLRSRFGVTVTRVMRHELEFVPKLTDAIEYGDMLHVVGEQDALHTFAEFAGHRARSFDETDMISLGVGMIAGVLLGTARVSLGGNGFALGMAGGPLCVGLLLAHFGRIGPIKGHIPAAARLLMTEAGLVLFLAGAGAAAGGTLGEVLRDHGVTLCLASCLIAVIPMACGALLARYAFKMNLLEILGAVCGGMTSTPGLGVLMSKTDSDVPVISYTTAYPIALIVVTIFAKVLVSVLARFF